MSLFAGVVSAAALLRAAARIFVGFGAREPEAPDVGGVEGEEPEDEPSTRGLPWTMALMPLLALAAAVAWNLWPAARALAASAAAQLGDHGAYLARVLGGDPAAAGGAPRLEPSWGRMAAAFGLAVALALGTLWRDRVPRRLRARVAALFDRVGRPLRELHSGHVGDQVAWLTVGAAIFAGAFALAAR
jgi:multicomponent Na+:H+ antiporter subunit D